MRIRTAGLLIALATVVPAGAAWSEPSVPPVDPAAVERLEAMGGFLREQRAFAVRAETATDEVLENGQKVQLASTAELYVRRPDKLRADVVSDRKSRQFYYDGKSLTVYGPRTGFYATVAAPATLAELVAFARDEYDIEMPLADLFAWGTDEEMVKGLTSAVHVGTSRMDGVDTDHYAFRQPGLDWQIWIQRGRCPLPRKIVLTTTDDEARPEHAVTMTWDLAPATDDRRFSFVPPSGSSRIAIVHRPRDAG